MSIICQIVSKIALIFLFAFMLEIIVWLTSIMINDATKEVRCRLPKCLSRNIEITFRTIYDACDDVKSYSLLAMSITSFCFVIFVSVLLIVLALATIIHIL